MNTCATCDLHQDRWNPLDPLYLEGSNQCPDCRRDDLNEEAARKNTEK